MMLAIIPHFFWSPSVVFKLSIVVSPARDRTAEIEQLQRDLAHARAAHEQSRAAYEAELLRCGETVSHLSFLLLLLSIFSLFFCLCLPVFCSHRHTDTHTLSHLDAFLLYRRNEDLLAVRGQAARERRTHETVVADTERQLDVMRARVERDGHGNLVADLFIMSRLSTLVICHLLQCTIPIVTAPSAANE